MSECTWRLILSPGDLGPSYTDNIVGIPIGAIAPLVPDLFLYCYERDFMDSLNHDNQAGVIEAFNSTTLVRGNEKSLSVKVNLSFLMTLYGKQIS